MIKRETWMEKMFGKYEVLPDDNEVKYNTQESEKQKKNL